MVNDRAGWLSPREEDEITQRLARFTFEHQHGQRSVSGHAALTGLHLAATADPSRQAMVGLPGRDEVATEDVLAALKLVPGQRGMLDAYERDLIEAAVDRGLSWEALGAALGGRTKQAMQQRYKRLSGRRSWPTRRRRARSVTAPAAIDEGKP